MYEKTDVELKQIRRESIFIFFSAMLSGLSFIGAIMLLLINIPAIILALFMSIFGQAGYLRTLSTINIMVPLSGIILGVLSIILIIISHFEGRLKFPQNNRLINLNITLLSTFSIVVNLFVLIGGIR